MRRVSSMKSLAKKARLAGLLLFLLGAGAAPALALPPDGPPGPNSGSEDDRPVGSLPIVQAPSRLDLGSVGASLPGTTVILPVPQGGVVRFFGPAGAPVGPSLPIPKGARSLQVEIPGVLADQVVGLVVVEPGGKTRVVRIR